MLAAQQMEEMETTAATAEATTATAAAEVEEAEAEAEAEASVVEEDIEELLEEIAAMKLRALREALAERGLNSNGKKAALETRLLDVRIEERQRELDEDGAKGEGEEI